MASLKFDIGLDVPDEMPLSSTAPSSLSSIMSTVKSKIGRGASAYESTDRSTYSSQNVFIILRDFLQPNTTLSLESVVNSLSDMLPENAHVSEEVYALGVVCLDMAEQIPYHHPSHQKMARLLEKLGQSTKVNGKLYVQGKPAFHHRYQRLGEYMREQFANPDEDKPETYVNYHAFVANIHRYHVFPSNPTYAIWAMRDALEKNIDSESRIIRDSYVLGAAQWILWDGQNLFAQVRYPGDVSASDGCNWKPGELYQGESLSTIHRWHFWRDCFRALAGEKSDAGDECKRVAIKAADMMDALEKNMSF